ncbi:unnamed protein product [Ectocarpus fasciculatus]
MFRASVCLHSAQETPETPAPSNSGLTTTAETPAPSNSDLTTGTDETPAPVHVHTDDMEHDDETMGPTASPADDEGDGAAAIGGSARMTAVVSCALAALAAGAAWGL